MENLPHNFFRLRALAVHLGRTDCGPCVWPCSGDSLNDLQHISALPRTSTGVNRAKGAFKEDFLSGGKVVG